MYKFFLICSHSFTIDEGDFNLVDSGFKSDRTTIKMKKEKKDRNKSINVQQNI